MIDKLIPPECCISVPSNRYDNLIPYIESAEAYSRNMFRPVFIVDMFKKNYLYVSNNFSFLLGGYSGGEGVQIGQKRIPFFAREDVELLATVFKEAYELFKTFPIEERMSLVFSFSFRHHLKERKNIVHQCMTPLSLTDDGDIWLLLCTTSFSSKKESGDYIIRQHNSSEYMQYNVERKRWYHKEGLVLSNIEKEILLFSAQGYTMKEIAIILEKTEDIIKMYKRVLFSNLKVKSITEALLAAVNLNLI